VATNLIKRDLLDYCKPFSNSGLLKGYAIADSALYSGDNLRAMTGLQWLTRVPLSIKEASSLVDSTLVLTPSVIKGYAFAQSKSEYAGVSQRWILIESEQRRKSDLKPLAKKLEQYRQNAAQDLQRLSTQEFACTADAVSAAQNLSAKMTWHQLCDIRQRKNVTMIKLESLVKKMFLSVLAIELQQWSSLWRLRLKRNAFDVVDLFLQPMCSTQNS
jgi:transposase